MTVASGKRNAALKQVWQAFDHLRGSMDSSRFGIVALALVFVRASREDGWTRLRSAYGFDVTAILGGLRDALGREIEITAGILDELPRVALIEMTEAVDAVAGGLGNVATFRLILEEFATTSAARDGVTVTPDSVAAALAGLIDLTSASSVYDPFCRRGELLIAAATRAHATSGRPSPLIYGTTPDSDALLIARMNLGLHHIAASLDKQGIDELAYDLPAERRFSRILTNPPFNASHWTQHHPHQLRYGPPPKNNANFAWLQYAAQRLEPGGKAAVIMPNGAAVSTNPRERHIRGQMVADGCVEALISLPPSLFSGTGISATIWLENPPGTERDKILFIDASNAGHMVSRTQRELGDPEINEIVQAVESWRSGQLPEATGPAIRSVAVPLPAIRERDYCLSPSVYLPPAHAETKRSASAPSIRQLVGRLEAEHAAAIEKDSIAMHTLKKLDR
jgi:type I restriction enzyme M protein